MFDEEMAKNNPQIEYTDDDFNKLLSEMELEPSNDPEIFEIEFELEEVLDRTYPKKVLNLPVIATEISPNGASLMFQLSNLPKSILDRLNG